MKQIRSKRRFMQSDYSVTELIGLLLMLLIVVSTFSVVYINILNDEGPEPKTFVKITGEVIGKEIIFEHQGGEDLQADTVISIDLPGTKIQGPVSSWLNDINNDLVWNLGERMVFPFEYNLEYLDDYAFIDTKAMDPESNSIVFMGPVKTRIVSDVGVEVFVDNTHPSVNELINITIIVTSYGGDVNGSGNVRIKYLIPDGLLYAGYSSTQGVYDNQTGIWEVGNVLVGTPATINVQVKVIGVPYHIPIQLGFIFDGSEYTAGSVNVWQNTYLNALMFALDPNKYGVIPTDGSVELSVIKCGWKNPPRAEIVLMPTIITEDNAHNIGQDLRNTPYPGGYSPISSALRLITDTIYNSKNYLEETRQIVLIVSSGNPDCIWDSTTADGYGGIWKNDKTQVQMDVINSKEFFNQKIKFNQDYDELDAITVAKDVSYRNSTFFNESVVMPQPGHIYDINNPIVDPGWVFEVNTGKEEFQEALNLILDLLLNSICIEVSLEGSTTVDLNPTNNDAIIIIDPNEN